MVHIPVDHCCIHADPVLCTPADHHRINLQNMVNTRRSWSQRPVDHGRIHLQLIVVYNRRSSSYTPAAHGRINPETIVVFMVVYTCGSRSYTVHTYTCGIRSNTCTAISWSYLCTCGSRSRMHQQIMVVFICGTWSCIILYSCCL